MIIGSVSFEHQFGLSVCRGEVILEGTENEFKWDLPEGWSIFKGSKAKEMLASISRSASLPSNAQHLFIYPRETFSSSIILTVGEKRFDYFTTDLKELKGLMEDQIIASGDKRSVEVMRLLNRSDGQKVLELIIHDEDDNVKKSAITVHAVRGQIQGILTSGDDTFSADREVLMSLIDRVPFRIYHSREPLIDSYKWYRVLGTSAVGASIGLLIVHFLNNRRKRIK